MAVNRMIEQLISCVFFGAFQMSQVLESTAAFKKRLESVRCSEHYEAQIVTGLVQQTINVSEHMQGLFDAAIEALSTAGPDPIGGEVMVTLAMIAETTRDFVSAAVMILPHDKEAGNEILARAMQLAELQHALFAIWPWPNHVQIDEARRQYDAGELMDLESFVDGLRGV